MPPAELVTWDADIGSLLKENCALCHGNSAGLSLETYEAALAGGRSGAVIVPGDGEGSLLVQALARHRSRPGPHAA